MEGPPWKALRSIVSSRRTFISYEAAIPPVMFTQQKCRVCVSSENMCKNVHSSLFLQYPRAENNLHVQRWQDGMYIAG